MLQLLRGAAGNAKQYAPVINLLAPVAAEAGPAATGRSAAHGQLLGNSSSHQLQQQRGAAKKKAQATGKAAKGKKGQQQPAKKQKQKMDSKPFDEKDPLMQKLIAMLVPAAEQLPRTADVQREAAARALEYRRQHNKQHKAWSADLRTKLALKTAALRALPPDLRAAALEEDLTPFPLTRHFLYDSPPDSYKS